ncbi:putative membrane protein [Roseibium hamelinense]|uniref:Putative membrane protein n=1 Tax=Roseibium hamelinense TaxID=150831 RepID=A0A562TGI5_9HYPH|nr:DUF2306 domain-containing protein [Roseibium hamelinense]MTI46105.1 DUF2306 domain-containing protein [Roseibium hamelinense]TWI92702.1 putative membrane protein [Roseibium hamelinense]
MGFAPLIDAGFLIASHALAALAAFFIGTYQLIAAKGTGRHQAVGYVWAALMLWTAATSFLIYDIRLWGPFSPIHVLSVLALFGLISGILEARRKDVREHRRTMILLYTGALLVAGFFAFMPGRLMYDVLFGG